MSACSICHRSYGALTDFKCGCDYRAESTSPPLPLAAEVDQLRAEADRMRPVYQAAIACSALYTLAHNIQVGAALVMAYCEGCDECGSWGPGNGDVFTGWRPNVDGKGV